LADNPPQVFARKRPWHSYWSVRLLLFIAMACAVPACQCALLNVVDPPFTETMLQRAAENTWATGEWRMPTYDFLPFSELPRPVLMSAIASEDRKFFTHNGFDMPAIRRAWRSYHGHESGKLIGGSTISQQVARNVFLWQNRSWLRKGLEAWYTIWLELLVPKRRILEVYVNIAEMAPMTFGAEAGAQYWYHKPAAKLRPAEAAHLLALLPSPRRWTPKTPYVEARARWILAAPPRLPW
jgi:monofunctional biosynthetic peptidoglycan transglycosylase